jgi:uncharacterized protein (TIGR02118 family)
MFKMMIFVKRKLGMSHEEFVDYYENHHAMLAARLAPHIRKYVRNYIYPIKNENYSDEEQPSVDCVTEVWYDNENAFEDTIAELIASNNTETIMQDEARVFDRAAIRWFKTIVRESDLEIDRRR